MFNLDASIFRNFKIFHPDGKRILFSALEDVEELWVMRNLPLN